MDASADDVQQTEQSFEKAEAELAELEASLFQPGGGSGDGGASQRHDEHRLASARRKAETTRRAYEGAKMLRLQAAMLRLQQSQHSATWASFAAAAASFVVAVIVGIVALTR